MPITAETSRNTTHSTTLTQPSGRIIGIDYGSRRIGVAVSDPLNIIARGVGVIPNDEHVFEKIGELVNMYTVSLIVIGMPYTLRGEAAKKAQEVEKFVNSLKKNLNMNVVTIDERFTSTIAQQTMHMMGTTRKQRRQKGKIDEMASALILQSYLDRKK